MKIKKDGLVIFNSIDNTGSTDEASLGARYTKGRLDSTDSNLRQNYYTKDEVQQLISGMGRTKIVTSLYEDWFVYIPVEETTEEEIYYQVSSETLVAEPSVDDLPTYYRMWENEETIVPTEYFIACAQDTEIVAGQSYYTVAFTGPGPKSTLMKNYEKAKIHIESNTYYFVGNDEDGYLLYYYDADFKEAIIGDFKIDFSQYAIKGTTIGSHNLENNITAQNIQDDIKDLTTTLTNKTIDADDNTIENIEVANFKTGVVKTAMPETPVDTELLSAKAINDAKQDKLTAGAAITTVGDNTTISQVDLTNKRSHPIAALNVWNYIKGKFTDSTITTLTDNTLISNVNAQYDTPITRFSVGTLFTYLWNKIKSDKWTNTVDANNKGTDVIPSADAVYNIGKRILVNQYSVPDSGQTVTQVLTSAGLNISGGYACAYVRNTAKINDRPFDDGGAAYIEVIARDSTTRIVRWTAWSSWRCSTISQQNGTWTSWNELGVIRDVTLTPNTAMVNLGSPVTTRAWRVGKLVYINFNGKFTTTTTGNIFTGLPKSKYETWGVVSCGAGVTNFKISAGGTALVKSSTGTTDWYKGTFIYECE